MESKADRVAYLEYIKEKRGFAAMSALREEVKRQWDSLKNDSTKKKSA